MAQEVKKCGDDPTPGFLVHENEHWTQEHEKETQLQKKRRKERALEAAAHNGLTTEEKLNEIGPDHEQAVEDFKAARSQKVRSYLAKKIRDTKKKEKAAASIFSLFSGKKVFISTIQAAPSLVLDQHMDKLGAKYESSLLRADAFVVPDVTDPAEETLWHAFLSGGLLLSPQAFSHGEGPAVKYCCAVSIRRTVYISSGFQEENPHLCAAITGRMQQLCNMWKLLKDMPLFLQCLQKAQLRHRPSAELVAFVTQKESKQILSVLGDTGQPTTGLCCKFLTRTNAADFLCKVEFAKHGLCGR